MIHSLLTTIIPMLAASLIMMGGGLRLAKTSQNEITPHDREKLLEFSHSFQKELTRLESLHQSHLNTLSKLTGQDERFILRTSAQNIEGVESIYLFQSPSVYEEEDDDELKTPKPTIIKVNPATKGPHLSLATSARKHALTNSSIHLPITVLDDVDAAAPSSITIPSRRYQVHFFKPKPDTLVAFVVNQVTIHGIAYRALSTHLERPGKPLTESNERVLVSSTLIRKPLLLSGPEQYGPAAAFIPLRSHLGDFEILAWDGISTKTSYNQTTLVTSIALALLLNLIGLFLFVQHRRSTKLAAERVSFVNQVSHELGTPLTNLNLNLDLADEFAVTHPDESKKRLGLVRDELARLSRLVANVLTFSSKERNKLEIQTEPCSPKSIIEGTINTFRPILERSHCEIATNLPQTPPLLISPDALSQIITNLVSNVEKYALDGNSLAVSMIYQKSSLIVTVSDQGPGVPSLHRQKIFAPFKRVSHKTTEGISGVGLGLAISRELANKMGGNLELLDSSKGACFQLTIPAPLAP